MFKNFLANHKINICVELKKCSYAGNFLSKGIRKVLLRHSRNLCKHKSCIKGLNTYFDNLNDPQLRQNLSINFLIAEQVI